MQVPRKRRVREAQLDFEALHIEGGLFSPEWLAQVAALAAPAQSEADYAIPKGLTLRDEIGRAFRIARAHHAEFAAGRVQAGDPRGLAERFVYGLLHDAFGFASLGPVEPVVIAERAYPIGFAALDGRVPVVVAPAGFGLDSPSPAFGDGTRKRSAFGLAQEYLNAAPEALYGLVADGLSLRIVRDNASLTRPAWLAADLERLFAEERYADFTALWLLAQETRFGKPGQAVTDCPLEAWREAGREQGTRAREALRRGVEEALTALGQGFLDHPQNTALRDALASQALTPRAYFNELLRLVYRLIFLLTVEERGLLHPQPDEPGASREGPGAGGPLPLPTGHAPLVAGHSPEAVYGAGYSLRRLAERALRRSAHDRFSDLWEGQKIVFRGLRSGEPRLGLPALGGLFAASACPTLDVARLENRALMGAVFRLAWLRSAAGLVRVNWRDMGPEELGSVYESLLELVPQLGNAGRSFTFATGDETKGNARKTTGSYYTPDSLVQVLLDSALEPVIAETLVAQPSSPAEALLGLSIVDPACGSGHFLLAAARRLAAHVARVQTNGTPAAAEYRRALRQVVGHCLYGVDLNPMAVELCKVSLWMEAVEPGLPLTFLDAHIRHGNALIGTTPALMADGVPAEAFAPLVGDDRQTAAALKRRNKQAAAGQRGLEALWAPCARDPQAELAAAVAAFEAAPADDAAALSAKEAAWAALLQSAAYREPAFVADAWCAAFVWPKQPGPQADAAPTNELWRELRDGRRAPPALTAETVATLARDFAFFHWPLAFPQVFARGGFDVVLGNPPWERVKLQEQEFFAAKSADIANAPNAAARKRLIAALPESDRPLWDAWQAASRRAEGESHILRNSGRYPLCGKGDINTYAVFAEHNRAILGPRGRAGFIVPTGIATDDTTKEFFADLVERKQLAAFYGFENEGRLFAGIDHRVNFCLQVLSRSPVTAPQFSAFVREAAVLRDPERVYALTAADIATLNPNTRTCPVFRTRRDAAINLAIYRHAGVLWREDRPDGNPWGLRFMAMLHMANDSGLFRTRAQLEAAGHSRVGNVFEGPEGQILPLIEAKMVYLYNHRFGDFALLAPGEREHILPQVGDAQLADAAYLTTPRYWVAAPEVEARLAGSWSRGWLLGWRDVTDARSSVRTVIASLIPRVAVGHKFPLMMPAAEPRLVGALYANLCSFALDYAARQKIGGTSLTYFIFKQLPVLPPDTYARPAPWAPDTTLCDWMLPRVLELTYTACDLEAFARDVGYAGPPFRWDPERRFVLRAELDAAFFHLYGLSRADTEYVIDTFPIVRKADVKAHGHYRTQRAILAAYDALRTPPYRSPLDPPPADPRAAHGAEADGRAGAPAGLDLFNPKG